MNELLNPYDKKGGNIFKLVIPFSDDAWHGFASELVWCERVEDGVAKILNSPFFAMGISYGDLVAFHVNENVLIFDNLISKSGHSTYRILLENAIDEVAFFAWWGKIEVLGCTYESYIDRYKLYSVDVPPDADISEAYRILELGVKDGVWDFDEGDYGRAQTSGINP